MENPKLTEPGVKYFMNQVLKHCNQQKTVFTNTIFNLILFLIFVLIIGGFLYYKYRGKLTPQEKEAKLREQKQDIMFTFRNFSNFPFFEVEPKKPIPMDIEYVDIVTVCRQLRLLI